jgi:O-antigen ligase/Flp pilus assembly protein TadD
MRITRVPPLLGLALITLAVSGAPEVIVAIASVIFVSVMLVLRKRTIHFGLLETVLILIVALEGIDVYRSNVPSNAVPPSLFFASALCFYLGLRLTDWYEWKNIALCLIPAIAAGAYGCRTLLSFVQHSIVLHRLGFDDLTSFRGWSLMLQTSNSPGAFGTTLIALLPFPLSAWFRATQKTFPRLLLAIGATALLLICIASTFLRGLYMAATVWCIISTFLMWIIYREHRCRVLGAAGLLLLVTALPLIPLVSPVAKTFSFTHGASQQRSMDGRILIWQSSLRMAQEHLLLGQGLGNFGMKFEAFRPKEDDLPYVGQPFNLALHIICEQGLVGLTLFGSAFLFALFSCWRTLFSQAFSQADRAVSALVTATFVSAAVRDLTYSSILTNQIVLLLVGVLLETARSEPREFQDRQNTRRLLFVFNRPSNTWGTPAGALYVCILSIAAWTGYLVFRYGLVTSCQQKVEVARDALQQKNFRKAQEALQAAITFSPHDPYLLGSLALVEAREGALDSAILDSVPNKPISPIGRAHLERSQTLYRRALSFNPNDEIFLSNLAWVDWALGDRNASVLELSRAVAFDPTVSLYLVELGLLTEARGDATAAMAYNAQAIALNPSLLDSTWFHRFELSQPAKAQDVEVLAANRLEAEWDYKRSPIILAKLGALRVKQGRLEDAEAALTEAANQLPSLPGVWNNLGRIEELQGRSPQRSYEKAIFIDHSILPAALRVAQQEKGANPGRAVSLYVRAVWATFGLGLMSPHARRASIMYHYSNVIGDDVLPEGLLSYISPELDLQGTCRDIVELSGDQALPIPCRIPPQLFSR